MVLSGDAMKEMARQAKATREERRSGLDGRHKYMISKVSICLKKKHGSFTLKKISH